MDVASLSDILFLYKVIVPLDYLNTIWGSFTFLPVFFY